MQTDKPSNPRIQALDFRLRLAVWHLLAAWLAVAAPTADAADGVEPGLVRLGMVNAQTGPASALGQGMLAGAQAVFNEVNARGGVHGRKIVLRVADDAYEPEQTLVQTMAMVQEHQVLVAH